LTKSIRNPDEIEEENPSQTKSSKNTSTFPITKLSMKYSLIQLKINRNSTTTNPPGKHPQISQLPMTHRIPQQFPLARSSCNPSIYLPLSRSSPTPLIIRLISQTFSTSSRCLLIKQSAKFHRECVINCSYSRLPRTVSGCLFSLFCFAIETLEMRSEFQIIHRDVAFGVSSSERRERWRRDLFVCAGVS
jgi:hypothetical protein